MCRRSKLIPSWKAYWRIWSGWTTSAISGLLLWLCALMAPERLAEVESRVGIEGALGRYRDAKQGRTMELAWFLTGLCQWGLARPEKLPELREPVFRDLPDANEQLRWTWNFSVIWQATEASVGRIRGLDRQFCGSSLSHLRADQVLPSVSRTGGTATCARVCYTVCAKPRGRSDNGGGTTTLPAAGSSRVIPVFSVHQHGDGPDDAVRIGRSHGHDFTRLNLQRIAVDQVGE